MTAAADRYRSFVGIDFEGNIAAVLGHLERYLAGPAKDNPLWLRFAAKLAAIRAGEAEGDALLLLHAHTYYLVELFEDHDDAAALADLARLERECF